MFGMIRNKKLRKNLENYKLLYFKEMKVVSLIFLILLNSCNVKNPDCKDFKTGIFKYDTFNYPEKIIRTNSMQVEINPLTGRKIYTSVEWVSECEYILTYKKIINSEFDESDLIGEKIYVKILDIIDNKIITDVKSKKTNEVIDFIKVGQLSRPR